MQEGNNYLSSGIRNSFIKIFSLCRRGIFPPCETATIIDELFVKNDLHSRFYRICLLSDMDGKKVITITFDVLFLLHLVFIYITFDNLLSVMNFV